MANSSIPASLRLCAGGITSSCDFPSVMRIPILGTSGLDPDSGLKLFSRMKVRARPGQKQRQDPVNSVWHRHDYNPEKRSSIPYYNTLKTSIHGPAYLAHRKRFYIQNNEEKWTLWLQGCRDNSHPKRPFKKVHLNDLIYLVICLFQSFKCTMCFGFVVFSRV